MQKSELKVLIKQLVRESLTEIFAEMRLESIVEGVLKKHQSVVLSEDAEEEPIRPTRPKEDSSVKKRRLMEALGGEEMWNNVYGDIEESNPILSNRSASGAPVPGAVDGTEYVKEADLREAGLFKDYSRFVK